MDAALGDRLFPFSSVRKRMTSLIHNSVGGDADGQRVYSKGAAEIILESCEFQTKANGEREELYVEDNETICVCESLVVISVG